MVFMVSSSVRVAYATAILAHNHQLVGFFAMLNILTTQSVVLINRYSLPIVDSELMMT